MQHSPLEIKEKLLKALDKEYNVVDMSAVIEIISILEKTRITKEELEATRLGKYINELRRKTNNEVLAKRAKDLVRRWRDMILPSAKDHCGNAMNGGSIGAGSGTSGPGPGPGAMVSPGLANSRYSSRCSVVSPAVSLPSSASTSPGLPSRPGTPSVLASRSKISPGLQRSHHFKPASPASSKPLTPKSIGTGGRPTSPATLEAVETRLTPTVSPNQRFQQHMGCAPNVPKTCAANKRLRKDEPDVSVPVNKIKKNSSLPNGLDPEILLDECSKDSVSSELCGESFSKVPGATSNRGKTNSKLKQTDHDILKKKFEEKVRGHKVKTTQELVNALTKRGVPPAPIPNTESLVGQQVQELRDSSGIDETSLRTWNLVEKSDASEVLRNKDALMTTFLKSLPEQQIAHVESPTPSCAIRHGKKYKQERDMTDETVEEILAQLPPVNPDEILWDSESVESPQVPCEASDELVDRLQTEHLENINGNTDYQGSFREWHEMLTVESYEGDLLHILPYVVID